MRKPSICRICLRPNRRLNTIDEKLLKLHQQLCEYSIFTLKPIYCTECEHLLRKTYNFKNKCMKAIKVYDKWKKAKHSNKSVDSLCTLLPTTLSPCAINEHTACIYYVFDDNCNATEMLERNEDHLTFNIIQYNVGYDLDLKDQIKAEDYYIENNKNDIEMIDISNQNDIKKENQLILKTTNIDDNLTENIEENHKNNLQESENLIFNILDESNDIAIETNDISFVNDTEYDSNDSLIPLSKSCKKKIKNGLKKNEGKKIKNSREKSKKKSIKSKLNFSKERLKIDLEEKLELWGELKTEDGSIIDKEVILNCLDKITDERLIQLWDCIQCETPNPVTIRTFKHLMRNYNNEEQYSKVFDIEYFNTEQKMQEEMLRRKTYECYVNAKYKCEICYLVFYKPKHLENHTKMHKENAGDFACKICGLRFTTIKNLRSHEGSHGAAYRCRLCPLVTYYRDSMVNHYNQHEGKSYTCESCGKICKSMSGYKRHQYLHHRRGRHVCTTCGRSFVSALGVALHNARIHKDAAPPAEGAGVHCAECDLHFPTEEVFLKHKKTWHNQHKAAKNTKRARPKNPKPPSITCRICNAAGSIGWLTLHFRTEHPTLDMNTVYADKRTHLCHICAKGFWNATSLRYHLNSHTGLRPYACKLCPKRYHSGVALNEHKLRHLPPGKECKQCGKKFKTQSNLTNHMLFHTGQRRHKCTFCGKAFLHSTSLNEHIRGVHYNVRRVKKGVREGKTGDQNVDRGDISD